MSKISKLFKALSLIIKQPALLNKVLDDADVNRQQVISKYGLTKGLKTVDINTLFPDFDETVEPFCAMDGGSTPIDLALLKALVRNKKDCMYFEIGTWRGESAANAASLAKLCVTLNLPDEEMIQMGMDKEYVGLHRFFSKKMNNIIHLQANSQTYDFSEHHKKYDVVFIDGDHHYLSVKSDTQNAFKLLKDDSSVIVWHDYGNTPNNIRWDVLNGILDGTPTEKHQHLCRVSNTLCAIYTTQLVKAEHRKLYSEPNKYFSISVKTKSIT